jgi:transposase
MRHESPELNPIERVWAYLKRHYLGNRVYIDYDELFATGGEAWNPLSEALLQFICRTSWLTPRIRG